MNSKYFTPKDIVNCCINNLEIAHKKFSSNNGPCLNWFYEGCDESKLVGPSKFWKNGHPTLTKTLYDYECGLLVVVGLPNAGKSSFITNTLRQVLILNEDVVVVDLSFDDPFKKRIQQYIAADTGLTYSQINQLSQLNDKQQEAVLTSESYIKSLFQQERFFILQGTETIKSSTKDGARKFHFRKVDELRKTMRSFREYYPDKKIIMSVDSWSDIDFSEGNGGNDLSRVNHGLNDIHDISNELEIHIILSSHVRKLNGASISMEDIKGTSDLSYRAVSGLVVRNELKENALTDPMMYEDENGLLWPILTLLPEKNKVSSWSYPLHYILKSDRNQVIPLSLEEYNHFSSIFNGPRESKTKKK